MGRIGRVKGFARAERGGAKLSETKVDRGGGDLRTWEHTAPLGDDAVPLAGDFAQSASQAGTGRDSAVGYVDPKNLQKSQAGDKRIYARDATTGEQVVEVWLQSDGTATTENANGSNTLRPDGSQIGENSLGSYELQTNGDFVVNGVTIKADGTLVVPTSLTVAGKELAGHTHPITSGSSAPGPTGANT